MTTTTYQQTLLDLKASLTAAAPDRKSIAIERLPDVIDEIQSTNDRELAMVSFNRQWETVRAIEAALQRIAAGTYGQCDECGEEIHSKRLKALPWATLCRDCQELADTMPARDYRSFDEAA